MNKKYASNIAGHALVLGGSGGIGSEIVRALVTNGVSAISFTYGKNKAGAEKLAKEIQALGAKVYFDSIDQSDTSAFKKFLNDAVRAVGQEISVAVNSIGISPNIPLQEQTLDGIEGWRNVFEVNVFGCFISTREIAERMKQNGVDGSIVLITSTNGINSQSSISAHYDSSKAAQSLMMRIMAEEYAPHGIRINGVAPGWIETAMNNTLPEEERAKEMGRIWSGRFANPAEIATFVTFIAGPGGSYAIGQNFMIDGGYR